MIVLCSAADDVVGAVQLACPKGYELESARNWGELAARGSMARACIVEIDLRGAGVELLRTLQTRVRGAPILLITSAEPANSALLAQITVEGVVFVERLKTDVHVALEQLLARDPIERIARALETQPQVHSSLIRLLVVACRSERLPGVVRRIGSAQSPHNRHPVYDHWPRGWRESGLTPGRYLDFLRLIRAVHCWQQLRSWAKAAEAVGTTRRSLSRWASRHGGVRHLNLLQHPSAAEQLACGLVALMFQSER